MKEEYYIWRHPNGYVGNAPVWWCKGGNGYSAYLERAEIFTKAGAEEICGVPIGEKGEKYQAFPCDFIDSRIHKVFDSQEFRHLEQWNAINN